MFKKIAIVATLSVLAGSAFAADEPKWYAGADVGTTKWDQHGAHENGVGAFLGYRINDTFALEGSARRLGEFASGANFSETVDQLSISGLASVPMGNGFKAFGRLGVNNMRISTESTGYPDGHRSKLFALYGAGVSYDFTPTVTGRVEVQKPSSNTTSISTGVAFKF